MQFYQTWVNRFYHFQNSLKSITLSPIYASYDGQAFFPACAVAPACTLRAGRTAGRLFPFSHLRKLRWASLFPRLRRGYGRQAVSFLLFSFIYSQDILGDVNQDGSVDILDIVRTVNIVLEVPPEPSEYELWAADVNADADINILDVVVEVEFVLGGLQLNCMEENEHLKPCLDNLTNCCYPNTSHEFEWDFELMGDTYYSNINDIEVVSPENIWIVGRFQIPDTTQWDGKCFYNAMHWDGEIWTPVQIYYQPIECAGTQIHSIEYINEDDIWTTHGSPYHWDGSEWTSYHFWNMGVFPEGDDTSNVQYIYSSSPDNVYFAGNSGAIVHYNGSEFVKQETGTNVNLWDIAGTPDGEHIFACGMEYIGVSHTVILEFENGEWNVIYYQDDLIPNSEDGNYGWVAYVSVFGDYAYFTSNNGILKYNYITKEMSYLIEEENPNQDVHFGIIVAHPNNIITTTSNADIYHFNGIDWTLQSTVNLPQTSYIKGWDYSGNILSLGGHFNSYQHSLFIKGIHLED